MKNNWKNKIAGILALLIIMQSAPISAMAVEVSENDTQQIVVLNETTPSIQGGTVVIPDGASNEDVKQTLFDALVTNPEGLDPQSIEWEFYGSSKSDPWLNTESRWVDVLEGDNWTTKYGFITYKYSVQPLKNLGDGDYQIRIAGTETAVTVTKAAKLSSSITLNDGCSVSLPYNEDSTVNYDALREKIFNTVVASTNPEGLTVDDVMIEYYAENVIAGRPGGTQEWAPLEGGTIKNALGIPLDYPAISVGNQQIRISYAENDSYYGTSAETTVTITERPEAPYKLNETFDSVVLAVDKNLDVDYDALHDAIFDAIIESSDVINKDNVTITYYSKLLTSLTAKYVPLEGEGLYPAISSGEQKIRIEWAGNQNYAPTTIDATITVKEREKVQFNLNDAPYEVGMVFTDEQGYDYDATAKAIYNAVVSSTTPELTFDDIKVEYNVDKTGITDSFKPLDESVWGDLKKFGVGTWEIKISTDDTQTYRGNSVTVDVTTTDNRIASNVVLKDGASFTYNVDPKVMEQAIFDSVIDWENSTLPAKESVNIDDFTIEYKASLTDIESGIDFDLVDLPNIGQDTLKTWVPIEGKEHILGAYPQMGAGENQQIRISYNGDADYRPSENVEGTVTVNKAKVTVKVNSDNIYVDEQIPNSFITTNPVDKFDIYTVYAGITSNVTTGIYLDLPERYTDSAFLKLLDPVVEKLYGKSFTQMMNDGVTVGELRELFNTQELLDLLDKLNIDTGTFGQILSTINKLPSIMDSVRVSFGTPNRAGLYTVAAITDSKNYETGVGIGFLMVKMRLSGSKLTWNQEIPNGKLTAEQAKTFDFNVTLSYNGDVTVDQSNIHYLYSGFTSKWRIYSSTTTPPTEPGRYVMTVVTLGGNYLAAPVTRSFQITN